MIVTWRVDWQHALELLQVGVFTLLSAPWWLCMTIAHWCHGMPFCAAQPLFTQRAMFSNTSVSPTLSQERAEDEEDEVADDKQQVLPEGDAMSNDRNRPLSPASA